MVSHMDRAATRATNASATHHGYFAVYLLLEMLPMKLLQALSFFQSFVVPATKANTPPVPPGGPVKDSVADILNYTIDGMQPVITVSPGLVDVRFADTVTDPENLVASFSLTEGASASINGVAQVSGKTANNYNNYLNYSVKTKWGNKALDCFQLPITIIRLNGG